MMNAISAWVAGHGMVFTLLTFSGVIFAGVALGRCRLRGIGLGVAGVLFAGLVAGHLGVRISEPVLEFARDFGLVLFVYMVGLQIGPDFFRSFRKQGLRLNGLAILVVGLGAVLVVGISRGEHFPAPVAAGLFSGATTNTPSLGAAQQALQAVPDRSAEAASLSALAYAAAYPFGIVGIILSILFLRAVFAKFLPPEQARSRVLPTRESEEWAAGPLPFLPLFLGVALGLLLGAWPIPIPGLPVPISLGLAGGPLGVALLWSRIPRGNPFAAHFPRSANLALRELGILLFLACVGLKAGAHFADGLKYGESLRWMGWASVITTLPLLLAGLVARFFLGLEFGQTCGLLAGTMTDPPALAFAENLCRSEEPAVAYATVYPLTMLLRILAAQVIVLCL